MIRLGVAVRILGKAGLRARDGRRAEHAPHLSVSLLLVREVLAYLAERQIGCYRLADDLAPYLTDERHPEFARQLDECGQLLAETGALAHSYGIRLSMHMPMHVTLAAIDAAVAERSVAELIARAQLLDALGAGPDAVLVLHSDGLSSRWNIDHYPGLVSRHPTVIAGVLYRDHDRGYDDVTVLAVKQVSA